MLLRTAEATFPNALTYVPIINFNSKLEKQQKYLLIHLNKYIGKKCRYLSEISPLMFKTEPRDPVHWTADTAGKIVEHWLDQLNM